MAKKEQIQEQRRMMMLNEPLNRVIPKMAVPTIVSFLITSIYSLADTYFVSSLGTNATAAVSVNASLDQLIMMCGSMVAMGANSYIARLLGQGDEKKASRVLSTSFFFAFFLGALLLVFGNLFMTPMVRLLGATATCDEDVLSYIAFPQVAMAFFEDRAAGFPKKEEPTAQPVAAPAPAPAPAQTLAAGQSENFTVTVNGKSYAVSIAQA